MIREYKEGDEKHLNLTYICQEEWSEIADTMLEDFRKGYTPVILRDGKPVCICNCQPFENGAYVYFQMDKSCDGLVIREVKKLFDIERKRYNNTIYTYSKRSPEQDKLHRILGFEKLIDDGEYTWWITK